MTENSNSSEQNKRIERLMAALQKFYSVMGNLPIEPGSLMMMAEILCQSGTDEQIAGAMTRCARECRFPVRLPDFLQRIPGGEVPAPEAEMRAMWDVAVKYISRWGRWNSERDAAYIDSDAPPMDQKLQDVIRRSGGYTTYLAMGPEDFPFQQKRFFEEWLAWTAVEHVVSRSEAIAALNAPRVALRLVAPKQTGECAEKKPSVEIRHVPEPLTREQLLERQQEMKNQAAEILRKRGETA